MAKSKVVSSGLVINAGDKYLLVKPYGGTTGGWGIPKGKLDPGEVIRAAAIREVMEETNLDVTNNETVTKYKLKVDSAPFFHYTVDTSDKKRGSYRKSVFAFMVIADPELLNYEFKCTSMLQDGRPEIEKFEWFTLKEAYKNVVSSQKSMFEYLLNIEDVNNAFLNLKSKS